MPEFFDLDLNLNENRNVLGYFSTVIPGIYTKGIYDILEQNPVIHAVQNNTPYYNGDAGYLFMSTVGHAEINIEMYYPVLVQALMAIKPDIAKPVLLGNNAHHPCIEISSIYDVEDEEEYYHMESNINDVLTLNENGFVVVTVDYVSKLIQEGILWYYKNRIDLEEKKEASPLYLVCRDTEEVIYESELFIPDPRYEPIPISPRKSRFDSADERL